MGGDYSRKSFDALRDFAGVLLQQGHPTLDADWNELVAIFDRRVRAATVDTIGRAVVPLETPLGFQIVPATGPQLGIGRGRIYVDGLLAENHGLIDADNPPAFDRARLDANGRAVGVLDEPVSQEPGDFVDYAAQPYLPDPPALPATPGPHLVFLDVWKREVTPLKDPRLLEPALDGIDTATRVQTVWQVRVLADIGANAVCGSQFDAWDDLTRPSAARLTTATIEFEDPDEPCLLPPGGGYRGLENQLYRVELHVGGDLADARFKWSRDNASVGATIEAITDGERLQVRRIGRDAILRFRTGDWVEVTDDRRELAGLSGDLRRVEVDEDANELRLDAPLSADLIPGGGDDTAANRHSRVIRWDQSGEVRLGDGTLWVDLDAAGSDGLIPVPPAGQAVVLEAGITVSFALDPAGGRAHALDHWCLAARTAGARIEILQDAPPRGIHHHYARLAVVTFPGTVVGDCRIFWPPAFGDDCACTACVTAEGHNSGASTIQQAIASLPEDGGTVCLGPGTYLLDAPVTIEKRDSVRIKGHGPGTVLAYAGSGAAVRVIDADQIEVTDLAVVLNADAPDENAPPAAFLLRHCQHVGLQRTVALMLGGGDDRTRFGVALDGAHSGLNIADNLLFAGHAIGALADPEANDGPGYCALQDALIQGNTLLGDRGVSLDGMVLHLATTRIVQNAVAAFEAGVVATGAAETDTGGEDPTRERLAFDRPWSAGGVAIEDNTFLLGIDASGVIGGVPNLRVEGNDISSFQEGEGNPDACGVRLVEGFVGLLRPDSHIVGNRIGRLAGAGISIEAAQSTLVVKQNLIQDCAIGGVRMSADAQVGSLAFDNNLVERVGDGVGNGPAVGVFLASVIDGKVTGNTIRRVGRDAEGAGYAAGLEIRGAILLDVSHNAIAEIGGSGDARRQNFAIRMSGALMSVDISDNRLVGATATVEGDASSWSGITLDARLGVEDGGVAGAPAAAFAANVFPAFVVIDDRLAALSERGLRRIDGLGEMAFRIGGNLITDARPRSQMPEVMVVSGNQQRLLSGLTFTANQCRRSTGAGAVPVLLEAGRLAIANNLVRRESDADAMELFSGQFGGATATILGNITFGNTRLNGAALPAPWQALNILG